MKILFIHDDDDAYETISSDNYPDSPIPRAGEEIVIFNKDGDEVWGTVTKVSYRYAHYPEIEKISEKQIYVFFKLE